MEQVPDVETSLLNVDLDIEAAFDLAPLVAALGSEILELYTGPVDDRFQTHLELAASNKDAEATIQGFIDLIERLGSGAKQLWNDATTRAFNIGIQAGTAPKKCELALTPDCLASISRLGGAIADGLSSPGRNVATSMIDP